MFLWVFGNVSGGKIGLYHADEGDNGDDVDHSCGTGTVIDSLSAFIDNFISDISDCIGEILLRISDFCESKLGLFQ